MSNFDTIKAITDNLETVLKGLGINFTRETYDDIAAIPASILPHGQIFYEEEAFEYTNGQKPGHAEVSFKIRVAFIDRDPRSLIREQQRWAHLIRDGLTVNALNIDSLASSKLVSRVTTNRVEVDNSRAGGLTALEYAVTIRYREL